MGFLLGLLGTGQPAKPKPKPMVRPAYTEQQKNIKWRMLAPHIKKHFKLNKDVKEIAADLALADYYNSLKKDKK